MPMVESYPPLRDVIFGRMFLKEEEEEGFIFVLVLVGRNEFGKFGKRA
jgi:hypothetical protein